MNIKEIAQLAGVSPSTVSKIMNGKDSALSKETRDKVLTVVKNYSYVPYANIKNAPESRTFLLGVLLKREGLREVFLNSILARAYQNGYEVIVCTSATLEEETRHGAALCRQKVDGVIWQRLGPESGQSCARRFAQAGVRVTVCDLWEEAERRYHIAYDQLAQRAAELLLGQGHVKIGCLFSEDTPESRLFCEGYHKALFDRQIRLDKRLCRQWGGDSTFFDLTACGVTALLCFDELLTGEVYRLAKLSRIGIPEGLSVVCITDGRMQKGLVPPVTAIQCPYERFGGFLCDSLIARIEGREEAGPGFAFQPQLIEGQSIGRPLGERHAKIVIIGNINMDTVIEMRQLPKSGETVLAHACVQIPGGKGANQAVGAGRLGAETYLLGWVGKDHDAVQLISSLLQSGVHTRGVKSDAAATTGKAYIHVQDGGESSIVVYTGANKNLSKQDILDNMEAFRGSAFCLLQLETPEPIVEYAARVAVENGVKVILKPAAVDHIGDRLLENTAILVPNQNELDALVPGDLSLEEKAGHFLERGVETVIVTLAQKGCYLRTKDRSSYFPALDCVPVDTTGAADAFCAALAVYMAEGAPLEEAVRYATVAAGLSTLKLGVQPALVDRSTLEAFVRQLENTKETEEEK